ncbi:hypothetical protein E2C01_062029 [Portunus trituberculatus]|uniref:Uncharacterized protein n=1 Tax=Portunus trituberculatus TaxID=210409 RepID=A0A5B7HCI7_PORTR|nr:hypothetical protein [Portunus trituberculatus]
MSSVLCFTKWRRMESPQDIARDILRFHVALIICCPEPPRLIPSSGAALDPDLRQRKQGETRVEGGEDTGVSDHGWEATQQCVATSPPSLLTLFFQPP